ncbi:shikimate dehydrogenase [Frigoribacterium salinisoli]
MTRRRLAVLGSPIGHSLSPVLHRTAYDLLDLPFDYEAVEVGSGELPAFVAGLDDRWRGLSLTMPLKREVLPLVDDLSPLARRLGVANTLVVEGDGRRTGHNTDVDGIVRSVAAVRPDGAVAVGQESRGTPGGTRATVLGGGATAASAVAAVHELGADRVDLHLRDVSRAGDLVALADDLGIELVVAPLADLDATEPRDLVVSTLPGGAADDLLLAPAGPGAVLVDAAYDPWPSRLAERWRTAGGLACSGLDMLVEQALGQVRLFSGRRQDEPLPDEAHVRTALRTAVGLDAVPTGRS